MIDDWGNRRLNPLNDNGHTSSNWNWTQYQPGFSPCSITFGNGIFVAATYGDPSLILSSSDGITWKYNSSLDAFNPNIGYGNGVFVAPSAYYNPYAPPNNPYVYEVLVSSNLTQWTTNVVCNYSNYIPSQIAFGGGQFIGNFGSDIWTSTNAFNWIDRTTIVSPTAFAYGEGTFVVGTGMFIYQSGVFASDSPAPTILAISTYPGVTINGTAGAVYQIQSATNLNSTWQTITNFYLPYSPYIWVDTSSPAVGQKFYRSVQLQ